MAVSSQGHWEARNGVRVPGVLKIRIFARYEEDFNEALLVNALLSFRPRFLMEVPHGYIFSSY